MTSNPDLVRNPPKTCVASVLPTAKVVAQSEEEELSAETQPTTSQPAGH